MSLMSYERFKKDTADYLKNKFPRGSTILDIGAGDGVYHQWLGDHFLMDAVEVFEPYVEKYNLGSKYRNVFIEDIRNFSTDIHYNVVIMGDVLEHLSYEDARKILDYLMPICDEIVIASPYKYPQGEYDGNIYQAHHQPDLNHNIMVQRYPELKLLFQDLYHGVYVKKEGNNVKRYKIAVYTIAKNEEQFVDRWMDSMGEADYVCVLDTGSTDNTVQKLRERGAIVEVKPIKPWRFDVARNESMKLVPEDADILICTDLDEVLEKGWAEVLRENWSDNATRRFYKYAWSHNEDGTNARTFWYDKIHSNKEWHWEYPVHEALVYDGVRPKEEYRLPETVFLHHYPDMNKSRGSYLGLLELRAEEYTDDFYGLFYLGNEYMYHGHWENALKTYHKILNEYTEHMKQKDDNLSLCNIHVKIAETNKILKNYDEAIKYARKAIEIEPRLRDAYGVLASAYLEIKNYRNAIYWLHQALNNTQRFFNWTEQAYYWEDRIYDMLGLAYYYVEEYSNSLAFFTLAVEAKPYDQRLIDNRNYALNKVKEQFKFGKN